ncbi:hypothetical protein ACWD7F_17140 [Streptomyces sp. NPDC005122]
MLKSAQGGPRCDYRRIRVDAAQGACDCSGLYHRVHQRQSVSDSISVPGSG